MSEQHTPNDEPAADTSAEGGAPLSEFDRELSAFLGHSLMDDVPEPDEDSISIEPVVNGAPAPVPGKTGVTVEPTSVPQGTVEDAKIDAGKGTPAADAVNPADVIEMLGFGKNAPVTGDVTKVAPAPAPATTTTEDEVFAPFRTDWALPPAVLSGLFEAEDAETRGKTLVGLMSSAMNTLAGIMDKRMAEYHLPRMAESTRNSQQAESVQREFVSDFFSENGGYPDLRDHGPIVKRAIEVLVAKDPTATWENSKAKVAALARAVVKNLTGQEPPPAKAAPTKTLPPQKAQDTAFIAGGARPSGAGDPIDPNSPAGLLTDMETW